MFLIHPQRQRSILSLEVQVRLILSIKTSLPTRCLNLKQKVVTDDLSITFLFLELTKPKYENVLHRKAYKRSPKISIIVKS
jgi:hypothetical protein